MKIYIDAGHGGTSVGASFNGRKEQDDTLALALEVAGLLKKQRGSEIRMSRDVDVNTSIEKFCREANAWGADYILSIHRNASAKPDTATGDEAWVYSKSSAATQNKAAVILGYLTSADGLKNRGVHPGAPSYTDFGVNRLTSMASCLLEVGFINNTGDNEVFDRRFHEIANAVARGVYEAAGGIYEEDDRIPGDVDGDGSVTSADARKALRTAVGLEELTNAEFNAADTDKDGAVTSADARDILRKSVGLP